MSEADRIKQLEADVAQLKQEIAEIRQLTLTVVNTLSRVPEAIMLGPKNPTPGWIAKLQPKK